MSKDDRETKILVVSPDSPSVKLEDIHEKLKEVFDDLMVIRDTAVTCVTTARAKQWDEADGLATVIHNHIVVDIDDQLRAVTTCIEMFGGKTDYSDDDDQDDDDGGDDDDCDCCCHRHCCYTNGD